MITVLGRIFPAFFFVPEPLVIAARDDRKGRPYAGMITFPALDRSAAIAAGDAPRHMK